MCQPLAIHHFGLLVAVESAWQWLADIKVCIANVGPQPGLGVVQMVCQLQVGGRQMQPEV
jgi:hypothetical protein